MTVEQDDNHFYVSGACLISSEAMSVIRYFGSDHNVILSREIEILGEGSFFFHKHISWLEFESGSRLTRIESMCFSKSSIRSICIPASVEILSAKCFWRCKSLVSLNFESGSRLTQIGDWAFFWCRMLDSVCIPASVEFLGEHSFLDCRSLSSLIFESWSKLTQIRLPSFSSSSIVSICIPSSIEILCEYCFSNCSSLSSLTFEPDSKLTRIESRAFSGCYSLTSIQIPRPVREFAKDWTHGSSFHRLIFESGFSLRTMIETDGTDLKCFHHIEILECDC
jgi:hypothetical protein